MAKKSSKKQSTTKKTTSPKTKKEALRRVVVAEVLPEEEAEEKDTPEEKDETEIEPDSIEEESLPAVVDTNLTKEVAAVSPTDPLRRYLTEVQRHPLLSAEEEYQLAVKLRDTGDIEAAKKLVTANLRLVVKIAFEYRSVYANVMDLIQEGNMGLMKAVSKFDPTKGARFSYYSSWWIRSYILKYLLENFRLVKIGTTQAQKKLFYHLMREKERLEAQGLLPAPKLLADKLHVKEKEVIEMEQRLSSSGADVSIDQPVGHDEGSPRHGDFLPDRGLSADEELIHRELLRILEENLPIFESSLNEREKIILKERILADPPKTLQEVADLYGLTRERVRQIEAKMIEKLKTLFPKE